MSGSSMPRANPRKPRLALKPRTAVCSALRSSTEYVDRHYAMLSEAKHLVAVSQSRPAFGQILRLRAQNGSLQ